MKQFWTLFIFLLPVTLFAQPDGWTKEYFKEGSHYVISRQKNKVGMYSRSKGKFTIEPHKGYIIHLDEPQLLLDVYPKDEKVDVYHYYDKVVQQLETEYDTGNFWFGHILASQWDDKLKATDFEEKINDQQVEGVIIRPEKSEKKEDFDPQSRLNYYFENGYLRLDLYHYNTFYDPVSIKSKVFPDEDSIDFEGNVVYDGSEYKTILNSGYFNLKTGNWDIPPIYQGTNSWEGLIGAYYWPDSRGEEKRIDGGMVYDFYRKEKKEIVPTDYQKFQGYAFPLELWPFEDEEVWYDYDSIFVYHKNRKGVGLYKIPLSGKNTADGYTTNWFASEGRFEVEQLLEPKYDYIIRTGTVDYFNSPLHREWYYCLGAKGKNEYDILNTFNGWRPYHVQDTLFEDIQVDASLALRQVNLEQGDSLVTEFVIAVDDTIILRPNPIIDGEVDFNELTHLILDQRCPPPIYQTEILDNGQLVVNSLESECLNDPAPIMTFDGFDSTDAQGNFVYPAPLPGNYSSGVFDSELNDWLISPFQAQVYYNNGGYLIKRPVLNEFRNLDSYEFDFMKPNGEYIFKGLSEKEITQIDKRKYLISGEEVDYLESLFPNSYSPVYFEVGDKRGIVELFLTESNIIVASENFVNYSHKDFASIQLKDNHFVITAHEDESQPTVELNLNIPLEIGAVYQFNRHKSSGGSLYEDMSEMKYLGSVFEIKKTDSTGSIVVSCLDNEQYSVELNQPYMWDTSYSNQPIKIAFKEVTSTKDAYSEFKFKILNDTLIYFKNTRSEGEAIPIYDLESGQEKLDENGNVIYELPDAGNYKSGVFNFQDNYWLIKPECIAVEYLIDDNFLLNVPILDKNKLLIGRQYVLKQGNKEKILGKSLLKSKGKQVHKFSSGKINDSLIYINDHTFEVAENTPWMDINGLDSVDANGNIVYKESFPGTYKSGIYNVVTNEWLIDECKWINLFHDVFIVSQPILNSEGMVENYLYSVYNYNGIPIKKEVPFMELDVDYRIWLE